jgi:hypothetical protein
MENQALGKLVFCFFLAPVSVAAYEKSSTG